jgi:6-phosphogluconolactonase (cycloisomerase 2 family)
MHTPRLSRLITGAAATLALTAAFVQPARAESDGHESTPSVTQVYEATNAAAGNAIQVFDRAGDGTLSVGALVPTGGLGTGTSLASQGGVTRNGNRLLVVNGGDNTVTSFEITGEGLVRRDVESTGGVLPVSVTVNDNIVYVLNAGDDAVTGFRLSERGDLRPIAGSTRPLSGTGTGAAQVQFNREGDALVVTEKATNKIDTFTVGERGLVTGVTVTDSAGVVPYGFDIDRHDHVIVSEAATGSVSSYRLHDGVLNVVTGSAADTQGAPCWLIVSRDGRFAFTTNAASGTISSYRIARNGSLTLLAAVAGTTGAGPTDVAQSSDGRFLYARVRNGDVAAFAVAVDGSLTSLGTVTGATSVGPSGLAAS